jgi:hypothetical protein
MRVRVNCSDGSAPSRPQVSAIIRLTVGSSNGRPARRAGSAMARPSSASAIAGTKKARREIAWLNTGWALAEPRKSLRRVKTTLARVSRSLAIPSKPANERVAFVWRIAQ